MSHQAPWSGHPSMLKMSFTKTPFSRGWQRRDWKTTGRSTVPARGLSKGGIGLGSVDNGLVLPKTGYQNHIE
ncbi:hypothetical protein IIA15_09505 [candidate division TA06 bacterium]|nr:hypothetical protein [candidate division TA06 bacterium]